MAKPKSGASDLPKGFRKVEVPAAFDFDANPILQGTVLKIKTIPLKREGATVPTKVAQVRDGDGVIHSLWESAALLTLFDDMKPGSQIWVKYLGKVDLGENKTRKEFDIGIK